MKNSTINLMFAAALMMVASTVASAQTLKAEIPFHFRANGVVMAPGTYELTGFDAESRFLIRSSATRESLLLVSRVGEDVPKAWGRRGQATLAFACGEGACTLQRIWTANGSTVHVVTSSSGREQMARGLALIRLVAARAK